VIRDHTLSPLLSLRDLAVRFRTEDGPVYAVNGVSLDVAPGERLGLVGESGCGKSVTSLAIMRLLPSGDACEVTGDVLFEGTDLMALNERDMRSLRGREIAMVFQDPMTSLNPVLTIGEQIVETIRAHRQVKQDEARFQAAELLGSVGIPNAAELLSSYPHQFSGGMRQRVMIAMALALKPKLLIADEPTTALDVTIQAQVLELLASLTAGTGTAAILITHDLGVVAGMTQRTSVMYAGFVIESGTTETLFAEPRHPYTVGLLHSIPRLDSDADAALTPIEGATPDQLTAPTGCPFAPRCPWRVEVCWVLMPALVPVTPSGPVITSGPGATHVVACHNPVLPAEVELAGPARAGFVAAPPPGTAAEGHVLSGGATD
jgi:oligopeptide transport system ATP-binding protein